MMPAIASPSLNSATKARINAAPRRVRKSRSGSIDRMREAGSETGCHDAALRRRRFRRQQGHHQSEADQRRNAEQRRMPADRADGGDHAGGRDQQSNAIAPDVGRHGGALAMLGEGLDAPGVDHDVLAGGEEGDEGGQRQSRGTAGARGPTAPAQRRRRLARAGWRPASRGDGRGAAAGQGARRCRARAPTGTSASRRGQYSRSARSARGRRRLPTATGGR